MAALAEYRVVSAPRFSATEMDVRLYDSLVRQRALWNHLALHLVRDQGISVELRLARRDGAVTVTLRLHGQPSPELQARIAEVEALLPSEFRWQQVKPDTSFDELKVRMASVVRRLEYVDLPVPLQPEGQRESSLAVGGGQLAGRTRDGDEHLREIPSEETLPSELLWGRFCLPLPGRIDEMKPRRKALFEELRRAGSAVVSICVHPMVPGDLPNAQANALNWKRFIDPLASEVASAGFVTVQELRAAYDRFSLPPGYLVHTSIRIAGTHDGSILGLANVVAESLGGVRAFQVLPPTREVDGAALTERARDIPSLMSEGMLRRQRRGIAESLLQAGIREIAEPMVDFILLAPHLFTLEEAEQMVRLPVADDEGLPGLESEAVPPFSMPSLDFLPAGTDTSTVTPPPPGRIRIGMVRAPGVTARSSVRGRYANYAWHTVDPIDLTKHALIVGSTGSGKTMSTLFLVRDLARLDVPVAVIEPVKTEYYHRLVGKIPHLKRYLFEGNAKGAPGKGFVAFDPLRVPAGISVARHCSYLKSCFEAAFPLTDFLALLLENGLLEYYTKPKEEGGCGLSKFTRGAPELGRIAVEKGSKKVFPSFATFKDYLLGPFLEREFANATGGGGRGSSTQELKDVFRRRLNNLGESVVGESFKQADNLYIESGGHSQCYHTAAAMLCTGHSIIELDAIPDADQKALVMAFLLTYLFEHRQAEDLIYREAYGKPAPSALRHFLIVEEAHRLLASRSSGPRAGESVGEGSRAKAVSLFVDMLAEVRAYGQGIGIVEQIPTKIVPEAVKNTNLKIMLRLTAKDDREYLGEAMNFTEAQMRFVTNLKVERPKPSLDGEPRGGQINFVVFDEGVEQPLLLSLPLPMSPGKETAEAPQAWLYDEFFEEDPK